MKCHACDTEIQYPPYGAVSKGVAGQPMNDGQRGYLIRGKAGEELALCSYTIWNCHNCGLERAIKKFAKLNAKTLHLIKFEYVDGVGRLDEILSDLSPRTAA